MSLISGGSRGSCPYPFPLRGSLLIAVFKFLPLVDSLPFVASVGHEWNRCISSDLLWYAECCRLWTTAPSRWIHSTSCLEELIRVTQKRWQYFGGLVPWKDQFQMMFNAVFSTRRCVWIDLSDEKPFCPTPYLYCDTFRAHDPTSGHPETKEDPNGIIRKDTMEELHAELQSDVYDHWVRNLSTVTELALRLAAGHSFCLHIVASAAEQQEIWDEVPDPDVLKAAIDCHRLHVHSAGAPCTLRATALWNMGVGRAVRIQVSDPEPRWVDMFSAGMMQLAPHSGADGTVYHQSSFVYKRNAYQGLRLIERTCLDFDCVKVAKKEPEWHERHREISGHLNLKDGCFRPWVCGQRLHCGAPPFPSDQELEAEVPKSAFWLTRMDRSPLSCARWMPPGAIHLDIQESCSRCQANMFFVDHICFDCKTLFESQTARVRLCDTCLAVAPESWPAAYSRPTKRRRAQLWLLSQD